MIGHFKDIFIPSAKSFQQGVTSQQVFIAMSAIVVVGRPFDVALWGWFYFLNLFSVDFEINLTSVLTKDKT